MKKKRHTKFIFLFVTLISTSILFNFCLKHNFHSKIPLVNDGYDRSIYYSIGSWYPLNKIPYLGIFSEYPQIATYFFALPHIISTSVNWKDYNQQTYDLIFSTSMMLFLFGTIILLYSLKGKDKHFAYLMLLPASLYFSYNRYDILVAFLSILCLKLLSQEKYELAAFVLALGVWAKWYLIVLLPIFMTFCYSRYRKINSRMFYIFCLTSILIILPTFIWGGIQAFKVPYEYHLNRGENAESLFYLIKSILGHDLGAWYSLFLILQFSIMPLILFGKINSIKKVINWSALSILVFILFSKFYSPQWILWILPFLILRAKNLKDIIPIIIFDLITYLYFPVIFHGYKTLLYPIVVVKTIILLYFIATIFKEVVVDMLPN